MICVTCWVSLHQVNESLSQMPQHLSIRFLFVLCVLFLVVLIWSAMHPYDRLTWWLEVFPALLALPLLYVTFPTFPLTRLNYLLILIHAVILMIGGHYTYAEVPIFNTLQDTLELSRNYYDRLGHFAQGFIPAMIAREVLLRKDIVAKNGWLFFIVCCICLSLSAFYELIEWWVAVLTGSAAESFLGTQGDVWDTQWDMFVALLGAIIAQVMLKKTHDNQLAALESKT